MVFDPISTLSIITSPLLAGVTLNDREIRGNILNKFPVGWLYMIQRTKGTATERSVFVSLILVLFKSY